MTFRNTPVTRTVVLSLIAGSIAVSLLDIKHYFYILVDTHLWRYGQIWRLLAYQLCYNNSTEVLFAAMSFYNLRMVERLWGSRKFASFLLASSLLTAVIPPVIMIALRPVFGQPVNYVPAGATPVLFAVLAQYHALVPHMYKYRVATNSPAPSSSSSSSPAPDAADFKGFTFSDKSYRYAIACHLALLQWPGSVIGAAVGWAVGHSWREGVLPAALVKWRVPGWVVGARAQSRTAEFEALRRRLEGESGQEGVTSTTGLESQEDQQTEPRRRNMGQQIVDQFREVL